MGHRIRPAVSFALIGIVLVFAVQNVADVEVQFLVWSFALPRAILIVAVFALGMLIGWILHSLRVRRLSVEDRGGGPASSG